MKLKRLMGTLLALTLMATVPLIALADTNYGSSAVAAGQTYTLEQMLTYAMQDENLAKAEYEAILTALDGGTPFSNIAQAEDTHISLLTTLFKTYEITVPENTAAANVKVPATLDEAYLVGVQTENANIAMYDTFLAQADLQADVRVVFTALKNASETHLESFTWNLENGALGLGRQNGNGANGRNSGMMGSNYNNYNNNSDDCPLGEDCPMNSTQNNRQNGSGRNRR